MSKNSAARLRATIDSVLAAAAFLALTLHGLPAFPAAPGEVPGTASSSPQPAVAANTVVIENFAFSPKTLVVPVGAEVTWINKDDDPHTIVHSDEDRLFKSPPLDTNDSFSFVFKEPGTYSYYCSVHPHMTATVVVQ